MSAMDYQFRRLASYSSPLTSIHRSLSFLIGNVTNGKCRMSIGCHFYLNSLTSFVSTFFVCVCSTIHNKTLAYHEFRMDSKATEVVVNCENFHASTQTQSIARASWQWISYGKKRAATFLKWHVHARHKKSRKPEKRAESQRNSQVRKKNLLKLN